MSRLSQAWWANVQTTNHAVQVCNASTGHTLRDVAFCDCKERAQDIGLAISSYQSLVEALEAAVILIDALLPGVRHIALQDYAALNETPLKIRAALAAAKGE